MSRDWTKTKRGKLKVGTAVAWIHASKELARKHKEKQRTDDLLDIMSESGFPNMDFGVEADGVTERQINLNLMAGTRATLATAIADERPEVMFSRERHGLEEIGRIHDTAVTREMQIAGVPGELSEGVGTALTFGSQWIYWCMPNLPMRGEMKQIGEKFGESEPGRFHDHERFALAGSTAAQADPNDAITGAAGTEAGAAPFEGATELAAQHADQADKEAAEMLYWRAPKNRLQVRRVTYGVDFFADPMARRLKDCRWVAFVQHIPWDEVKIHPALRTHKIRELQPSKIEDTGELFVSKDDEDRDADDKRPDMFELIEFQDRKSGTTHYLSRDCDEWLERDESYAYTDKKTGRTSIIKPIADHPGFFTVVPYRPIPLDRNDGHAMLGKAALKDGLPSQMDLILMLSCRTNAVRHASAQNYGYDPSAVEEEEIKALAEGDTRTFIPMQGLANGRDINSILQQIQWRPPPPALFGEVNSKIAEYSIATRMQAVSQITSQPQAKTATAEQISVQASDVYSSELVRQGEVCYSYLGFYFSAVMFEYYSDAVWEELIGKSDWADLKKTVELVGVAYELPKTRFAPHSRDADPVQIKQLLDIYQLMKTLGVDSFGAQRYELEYIAIEALKRANVGEPPPYEMSEQEMSMRSMSDAIQKMLANQKAAAETEKAAGGGEASSNGKAKTPAEMNRDIKPRGDREGRSGGAPTPATLMSDARDGGPV